MLNEDHLFPFWKFHTFLLFIKKTASAHTKTVKVLTNYNVQHISLKNEGESQKVSSSCYAG